VLAKASATNYDTEWVARNPFDQDLNTTDSVTFAGVNIGTSGTGLSSDLLGIGGYATLGQTALTLTDGVDTLNIDLFNGITFPDNTQQTTALPSGLDDGYIIEWNADTNTYNSVPNDARTLFITARNITGTTIPKGSVVLITGASGNRPTIGLAQGDTSSNADGVIGITAAAINNNANGRVITEGLASNLDTDAFAAGDKLYLSAVTPGGLVNVRPVQPAHSVAIGVVTRSNPAVGSIEVRVQVGEHLEFLHDVLLTSKANGDFLVYESSTDLWKNRTLASLDLLTATAAAAVYQPLSGMSAYLTTSAAASTYLTQSNAATTYAPIVHTHTASAVTDFDTAADARVNALVPAASTTAAGKVELATDAEAVAGTSSTLAVTPAGNFAAMLNRRWHCPVTNNFINITSGTGAAANLQFGNNRVTAPTSGTGHGARVHAVAWMALGANAETGSINFAKKVWWSFRLTKQNAASDPNTVCRALLGRTYNSTPADLGTAGIGLKFTGNGVVQLTVHDGTNLTDVSTSYTPTSGQVFECLIYSDGSGNVTLSIDGTQSATTSAGPTGSSAANPDLRIEAQNTSSLAAGVGLQCTLINSILVVEP
jgi:hypothetical protein